MVRLGGGLVLVSLLSSGPAGEAAPTDGDETPSPFAYYEKFTAEFWSAEEQLQKRSASFSSYRSAYKSPLPSTDPLYLEYSHVNRSINRYLQLLKARGITQSWTLPTALYLGGIAAFTTGDYESAQKQFSRLLKEYPDYKRDLYAGDYYPPDPDFSQPVKPALTKLLLYCQLSTVPPKNEDHFAVFQRFNQTALIALSSQREHAHWLAHHPNIHYRREFYLDENYGGMLDQIRATALPQLSHLVRENWKETFPSALKKSGPIEMRKYLRSFPDDDLFWQELTEPYVIEVDQLVIQRYFSQARALLRKHDFAGTRKKYRQIIAEYPGSDASRRAEAELPKVVPVAIKFYKTEGDKNFNPGKKIGVPQGKAREFYEKMYNEDPDGGKADYAVYYWARVLGTEGQFKEALQKLHGFEEKFPRSKLRSKALFLEGFLNGDNHVKKISLAAQLMEQTAQQYPETEEAPEALWYGAFYHAQLNQFPQAIACLEELKGYPKSPRTKYAEQWRDYFQQKIQEGGQWP